MEKSENIMDTAASLYSAAERHMKELRWGDAVNTFREVLELPGSGNEGLDNLKNKAKASMELIARINGFVNKDLMNP